MAYPQRKRIASTRPRREPPPLIPDDVRDYKTNGFNPMHLALLQDLIWAANDADNVIELDGKDARQILDAIGRGSNPEGARRLRQRLEETDDTPEGDW